MMVYTHIYLDKYFSTFSTFSFIVFYFISFIIVILLLFTIFKCYFSSIKVTPLGIMLMCHPDKIITMYTNYSIWIVNRPKVVI